MSDRMKIWTETKKALEYHGVDQLLKDLRSELFLVQDLIGDKADKYDDELLNGARSILGSICGRLEDLACGRLPFNALYQAEKATAP